MPARQRAEALAVSGDTAGAVALLEHAVALGKVNLGEDDPGVLAAAHQLARVHQQRDDPSSARRVLEEAYAAGQWRLGDSDPLMLEISYDLGMVAEELGNRHEARKALTRVIEAGTPVLGAQHWAVLRARAYVNGDTNALKAPVAPEVAPATERPETLDAAPATGWPETATGRPETPEWPQATERPEAQERPIPPQVPDRQTAEYETRHRVVDEPTVAQPIIHPQPLRVPADRQEPREATYPQRSPAVFAAIAAVLAAIIAVAALVFVLADRNDPPAQPDQPVLGGGPPPADVRLRDFGTSVQVSWSDPGNGTTSFIIAGGHPGEVLKPMGEVGPGRTTYRLQGLNDQLDYCFAVLAVYSATEFASSAQSCLSRPAPETTG
jgi:hypothetical protein